MVGVVDQPGGWRRHLSLRSEGDDARPERAEVEIGRARARAAIEDKGDRPTLGVRPVARIGDVEHAGLPFALVVDERQGGGRGGEGDVRAVDRELVMRDRIGQRIGRRGMSGGDGREQQQCQRRTA